MRILCISIMLFGFVVMRVHVVDAASCTDNPLTEFASNCDTVIAKGTCIQDTTAGHTYPNGANWIKCGSDGRWYGGCASQQACMGTATSTGTTSSTVPSTANPPPPANSNTTSACVGGPLTEFASNCDTVIAKGTCIQDTNAGHTYPGGANWIKCGADSRWYGGCVSQQACINMSISSITQATLPPQQIITQASRATSPPPPPQPITSVQPIITQPPVVVVPPGDAGKGMGRAAPAQNSSLSEAEYAAIERLKTANNGAQILYILSSDESNQNYLDRSTKGQVDPRLSDIQTTRSGVRDYLVHRGFIATTHEDIGSTRQICGGSNCQFWKLDSLVSYSNIPNLFKHESMHNVQAGNNSQLHKDIWGSDAGATNPQQSTDNKAFQALIEGYADIYGCGDNGCTPQYNNFRSFYKAMRVWAQANRASALFNNVARGSFVSYMTLKNKYDSTDKPISQLLIDCGIR